MGRDPLIVFIFLFLTPNFMGMGLDDVELNGLIDICHPMADVTFERKLYCASKRNIDAIIP